MSPSSAQLPSLRGYPRAGMGYLCSRVRALSAGLLPRRTLESARAANSPSGILDVLLQSEYASSLRADVFAAEDLRTFEERLFRTYGGRLKRVREFVEQCAPDGLYLVTGSWDMHLVRTLLRSCLGRRDADLVHLAAVDGGTITSEQFRAASGARDLTTLLGHVVKWMPELGEELAGAAVAQEGGGPSLSELERTLERLHYRRLLASADRASRRLDREAIRGLVAFEIDLANVRIAIRRLERHETAAEVDRLYVAGGALRREAFDRLLRANEIGELFAGLGRGPLSRGLERGMVRYLAGSRSSVFERFFDEQRLRLTRTTARQRPVSLATPLWYLARAFNEVVNLRIILRGVIFDLPSGALQERLVYV